MRHKNIDIRNIVLKSSKNDVLGETKIKVYLIF